MAKPNHQFEKRQRELAKQKKKDEKKLKKLERVADPTEDEAGVALDDAASEDASE